jgi:hypothetical protein
MMSRRERIVGIASVVWIIVVLVRAISGPREEFFFVTYIFGALPVAAGWGIYLAVLAFR